MKAHRIPRWPPHVMRHTAASWLVQASVSLYEVQMLLGHEDPRTTQRYAHLMPGAHDAVRRAWSARNDHARATHDVP
ncbi:tyrosine-type recombinase/integrase [Nonomuraea bangladeshensis]|uniref:tyrosine-type recombinase/integrase n=1 Tax=Nonomuraea bangladeshensis TaxID=404385 RepID=UPI003CD0B999